MTRFTETIESAVYYDSSPYGIEILHFIKRLMSTYVAAFTPCITNDVTYTIYI